MRKLPPGLAISAAVHVIAVVCASAYEAPEEAPPARPIALPVVIEVVEPRPAVIEPLAVALVTDVPAMTGEALPAAATVRRTSRATAVEPTTTTTTTTIVEPAPTPRHPMMSLRRGYDLKLRTATAEELAARAPLEPRPSEPAGVLQPSGGGTSRTDLGPIALRADATGHASLEAKRNLQVSIVTPRKLAKSIGKGIADWYEKPNKIPSGSEVEPGTDSKPDHGGTVPIVKGSFDATDALMRRHGQDPYASAKLEILDRTRDERARIGARHRDRELARSTELVQKQLDRLWSTTPALAARKQALFELWDDCAETGDAALVDGARAARKLVIGFIRARLPAGGATAFTTSELAAFNRTKQSTATFAPYD